MRKAQRTKALYAGSFVPMAKKSASSASASAEPIVSKRLSISVSTRETKNIDTRDIYCLARGSYSFRTKGQLTFMRSLNSKLDDDDVLRDVDAQ